ncbi:Carboxypeptidase regulatory-like domain-containing protein [Ohtaekwangia koreensis]|uniref:Carboxypeptidase regulatory-like domain-containing protein n=2 Tax=Ohtaekwangia koreensis TaxID=688867 RepID=A0A1T5KDD4_9BACT|nr:Carboxypeptidase regulatory-like domain-containing protein [Ohtaekwangia koreensis]
MRIHASLRLLTSMVMLLTCALSELAAQSTQTIRGKVVDGVSNTALIGVSLLIVSSDDKVYGSTTDSEGRFRIDNVPVGRHTIRVTYIGYEEQTIANVIVTAGKEVVLTFSLTESVNQLNEVVIMDNVKNDKTATNNDIAVVSARSFNVDDTKRYAGAIGDPSRMAANFAGVVGGNDSRNDIVVRGNSPTGMLWQLEGLNIPNPNHFGALVSTGGPVSILNNNNLDKSDFMTSAFPSQYGNATAGVFDLRLRDGNNEKRELLGQVGFNGFEFGAEGPFSKKSGASYIANYRYSTLGLFQTLGIEFGTGSNTPSYQDLNFKVSLPTSNGGKWTIFGIGGMSSVDLLGSEADLDKNDNLYGTENRDSYTQYRTGVAGVSYEKSIANTYLRFTAGASATSESFDSDSLVRNNESEVIARHLRAEGDMNTQKYSFNFYTRTKFNARNSVTSGFYIDATQFDLFNRDVYANLNSDTVRLDVKDEATRYQFFSSWKHRFSQQLVLNAGAHVQYYSLNEQWALEPRVSLQYIINTNQSLSVGYGIHNQAQNITTSFIQTKTSTGELLLTNKNLDFTTSQHYVLTYDWNISENLRLKAEGYYQTLSNVPVERERSSFSALNTGVSFAIEDEDSLVNKGSGRNYGIELTLERFFSKGYYFLITTSLFDSKYKGSDGISRNTAFNTQYVLNALAGKEWRIGKARNFFSVNLKLTTIGGKRLTPIDIANSQLYGRTIYKESEAFSERQDPYFRADLRFSYRKEYKRSTLEVALDLQNLTNNENIFMQSYNARTNSVVTQYQQSFFPVPYVRFTF